MIKPATHYAEPKLLSKELADFARRQLVNATLFKGDERRCESRHLMVVPVWVVPIDAENEPTDEPFQVITRDVSPKGIGLFHEDEIEHDRLAIHLQIGDTDVDLAIELAWMRPMGPFYGSAGTYVEKLDRFPAYLPG